MNKNLSDEKLAELTLVNNDYFGELADRYSEKIRRYIARVIGNWQEAEDLVQDVFLKAYENIASFNSKMKFSSWLYRIAHNLAVNFIKKHYRFRQVEFKDEIKNELLQEDNQLEKISNNENKQMIRNALLQLKSRDREILELYYFEDKSYLEIVDILEMPINSVGSTIKRAKEKLAKIIKKINNEPTNPKN